MSRSIFMILLVLFTHELCAQGWTVPHYDLSYVGASPPINSLEGGYLMQGYGNGGLVLRKVDERGQTTWSYVVPNNRGMIGSSLVPGMDLALQQLPADSSYVVACAVWGNDTLFLTRINTQGQLISQYPVQLSAIPSASGFPFGYNYGTITSDGHLLVGTTSTSADSSTNVMALSKITPTGQVLWTQTYEHLTPGRIAGLIRVKESASGHYLLVGNNAVGRRTNQISTTATDSDVQLIVVDPVTGLRVQEVRHDIGVYDEVQAAIPTRDSGILIMGTFRNNNQHTGSKTDFILKLDAQGGREWTWISTGLTGNFNDAVENADGTFCIAGTYNDVNKSVGLLKLSATGHTIFEKGNPNIYRTNGTPGGKMVMETASGQSVAHVIIGGGFDGVFLMGVDANGDLYNNKIVGQYRLDANNNCQTDTTERAMTGQIVRAIKGNQTFYGTVDSSGWYTIELDTGQYWVSAELPSPYWQLCPPGSMVLVDSFNDLDTLDFALQALNNCTAMRVDLSAPFLRRCFNSGYTVQYANWGTVDAANSYVEVTLDPYLTYVSSTIPLVSQNGAVHRFDVGTVSALQQGSFDLVVAVDCDSTALGQVHCSEARIYPDTICVSTLWSGAIIEASSTCTPDSIQFTLLNTGAAMSVPSTYTVVEEHVMLRQAPYQLGSGSSQTITVPRRHGRVYRIEAAQEAGFPPQLGDPIAISNQVVCGVPPLLFQPDILGQFYQGNIGSSIAVDCQPNIGAYDPNDKHAQPIGYGPNHFIENNIPLNYRIRFQNTGTDTAFTVVILDTIDADLDPATLQMGPSSHPYTWSLTGTGVLEIRFDNILLPDSNVNEPLSHGFVKFQIEQQPNNPDGTRLTNRAAIYFDFNPPIITNEVFHTIGRDFVERFIGIEEPHLEALTVKLYPNPFRQTATLEVEGETFQQLQVELYSPTGQLLKTHQGSGNQLVLERSGLPSGIYFYRLLGDDQVLNTGKMVVQ